MHLHGLGLQPGEGTASSSRTRTGELLPAEFLATFPELSTDPASRPRVFGFNKVPLVECACKVRTPESL